MGPRTTLRVIGGTDAIRAMAERSVFFDRTLQSRDLPGLGSIVVSSKIAAGGIVPTDRRIRGGMFFRQSANIIPSARAQDVPLSLVINALKAAAATVFPGLSAANEVIDNLTGATRSRDSIRIFASAGSGDSTVTNRSIDLSLKTAEEEVRHSRNVRTGTLDAIARALRVDPRAVDERRHLPRLLEIDALAADLLTWGISRSEHLPLVISALLDHALAGRRCATNVITNLILDRGIEVFPEASRSRLFHFISERAQADGHELALRILEEIGGKQGDKAMGQEYLFMVVFLLSKIEEERAIVTAFAEHNPRFAPHIRSILSMNRNDLERLSEQLHRVWNIIGILRELHLYPRLEAKRQELLSVATDLLGAINNGNLVRNITRLENDVIVLEDDLVDAQTSSRESGEIAVSYKEKVTELLRKVRMIRNQADAVRTMTRQLQKLSAAIDVAVRLMRDEGVFEEEAYRDINEQLEDVDSRLRSIIQ